MSNRCIGHITVDGVALTVNVTEDYYAKLVASLRTQLETGHSEPPLPQREDVTLELYASGDHNPSLPPFERIDRTGG